MMMMMMMMKKMWELKSLERKLKAGTCGVTGDGKTVTERKTERERSVFSTLG